MKTKVNYHVIILFLLVLSIGKTGMAADLETVRTIEAFPVAISTNKTTNLIFPYAIKSVDRGSRDALVQKARGVENILQVKAATTDMVETNLTVITADGKLYSFLLHYDPDPSTLNYSFGNREVSEVAFSPGNINESILKKYAKVAAGKKKKFHGVKERKYGIKLKLTGLYVKGDIMYYRLHIENTSNIRYNIDQLRFFIRDRNRAKRTTYQEEEITPLYNYKDTKVIEGRSEGDMVIALPKRVIPNQKHMVVQLMEDHGGRHVQMKVKNHKLMKATVL
ncbi:Bacteroides conjugative transposon TraN protein [Flagellimonas taeanensis]|uniref:Bacteroides conjugative transposon TraN protein n=1 Tax=Flagellimonas taeanensis TaxID=1005926 RepID=A0A1M6SAZ6_9FLAO|nr:conjugative transposon protein TraN [Allomuricauda taeanensis]SFB79507.1 Bacteroides conjugative transposon TraN protein [Allomuricauda taeanensis]SHK41708.1 Bacteroides conjugative transposon TraN protein [Allomuricauda taeanensis]